MTAPADRQKVRFTSGDAQCAAWHYPGTSGACVIMTGGYAVTKEPGTDRFARRFHAGRVLGPGLRLPPPGRERRPAAPGHPAARPARRLAGRDRLRPHPARGRPGPDRHLELLPVRRPRLPGRGRATRTWPPRSPRRPTPTAWPPPATRPATSAPPALLRFTGRALLDAAGALAGRAAAAGAADRPAGHRRPAHHPGRRRTPAGPSPRRSTRTGGPRSPPGPRSGPGFYRPGRLAAAGHLPAAGRGGRPGPVGAGRARPSAPRAAPRAASWSGCPAGTTRRSWAATSRSSRPSWPS